jgi:hypothetical protein
MMVAVISKQRHKHQHCYQNRDWIDPIHSHLRVCSSRRLPSQIARAFDHGRTTGKMDQWQLNPALIREVIPGFEHA